MAKSAKAAFNKAVFSKDVEVLSAKHSAVSSIVFLELGDGSGPCDIRGTGASAVAMTSRLIEVLIAKHGALAALTFTALIAECASENIRSVRAAKKRK